MSDAKNDPQAVLVTAYEAIQDEYDRIDKLLELSDKNPLGKYAGVINSRFTDPIAEASIKLDRIKTQLESLAAGKGSKSSDEILKECWSDYFDLKTRLMPTLSTELLAVIGGVYLREKQLDDTRVRLGGAGGTLSGAAEPVSFSDMAEALVRDLATRSGKGWESVLIVGEERLTHSEAEIIRLRFPACDIWNLPFTAHEYGYLVARKKPPEKFRNLRDKVRRDVNPRNHSAIGSPPEDRQCFLQEVTEIWDQYHDQLRTEDHRLEFLTRNEQRLTALADAQESHLCRLYADAFATFFIGPAYVLALLYLRFMPDNMRRLLLTGMPPFSHRFVFALETLKWMNEEPVTDAEHNRKLFANEVYEQDGIPALWRATLKSLGIDDPYLPIVNQYQIWLREIKDSLTAFAAPNAIGTTYRNWRAVDEIKAQLLANSPTLSVKPEIWSVLSAAWIARWENRAKLLKIHNNALRLLNDPTVIKTVEKASPGGAATKQKEATKREDDITDVKRALAKDPRAAKLFIEMIKNSRFEKNQEILMSLIDNDTAYLIYLSLFESHPE